MVNFQNGDILIHLPSNDKFIILGDIVSNSKGNWGETKYINEYVSNGLIAIYRPVIGVELKNLEYWQPSKKDVVVFDNRVKVKVGDKEYLIDKKKQEKIQEILDN